MVFHIPYIRYDNYVSTVLETFLNILLLIPMPEVQKKAEKGINYKTNFPLLYPALSSWACSGKIYSAFR